MYYNPNLCFSVFRYFPFKKFNAMDHGLLLQIEPVSKLPEISANVICSYMGSKSIWIHKHRLQAKPQQRNPFLNYRKTLTCSLFRNGLFGCWFFFFTRAMEFSPSHFAPHKSPFSYSHYNLLKFLLQTNSSHLKQWGWKISFLSNRLLAEFFVIFWGVYML